MEGWGDNMDARLVERDHSAIHPDKFRFHSISPALSG
jgi:hypothetical protein